MVDCMTGVQLCYNNTPANVTGLDQLFNYTIQQMGTTDPATHELINPLGASIIGLAVLIPLFFIIFLILSRYDPKGAIVVSSFVCWIASLALSIMGISMSALVLGFFALFVLSLGYYYMATRT